MGKPSTKKKIILKKVKPVPNSVDYKLTKRGEESLKRVRRLEYLQSPENLAKMRRMRQVGHLRQSRKYRSYEDAQKFVKKLKLKSRFQWKEVYLASGKLPEDIPSHPNFEYESTNYLIKSINRQGWVDYETWLGLKPRKYRSFEDARKFARSLEITNILQWKQLQRTGALPEDIPQSPNMVYDEFMGWYDFFGHDKNIIIDRKLRREYRILFDRQISYFQNLNASNQKTIENIKNELNLDDIDFNDIIYNKMKSSLPKTPDFSNSKMILAERNSHGNLKNLKFLETAYTKLPRKMLLDIYKKLEKNSIYTWGDLINSNSISGIENINFLSLKSKAISIIFGKKFGNIFKKYYYEYYKIGDNIIGTIIKQEELLAIINPLVSRLQEIKEDGTKIEFDKNPEVLKLVKKFLKIINKIKIKKYQKGKTKRTRSELKLLRLKWMGSYQIYLYDEMKSLENEFVNNPDLGYRKALIYGSFSEVCLRIGKISKSLSYAQKTIDAAPDDPDAWFNKACTHGVSGEVNFACNSLLVAIGLGGNDIISDAKIDTDFSKIKNNDQFKKIINSSKQKLFST